MNQPVHVTPAEVVRRARSMVGHGVYALGVGGRNPSQPEPFQNGKCDCSGFVAWALGLDRFVADRLPGDWIETTRVYNDALTTHRMFVRVTAGRRPGDVIVYGDYASHQGHIGIVSEVDPRGRVTKVVHCTAKTDGLGAIRETDPTVFLRHGAIVARPKFLLSSE